MSNKNLNILGGIALAILITNFIIAIYMGNTHSAIGWAGMVGLHILNIIRFNY